MVVVHYKTYGLRPLVEAFVLTHDSGATDVDFNFDLLCGIHLYKGQGEHHNVARVSFLFPCSLV